MIFARSSSPQTKEGRPHGRKTSCADTATPRSSLLSVPRVRRRRSSAVCSNADVFRLNFSHGTHEDHKKRYDIIRAIEKKVARPISVLADLQGPKLRLGTFADGRVQLATGDRFELDLDGGPGTQQRVSMPHAEVFKALSP